MRGDHRLGDANLADDLADTIANERDVFRKRGRLHYRGDGLPPILASHVATVLGAKAAFSTLPIGDLLSSKSFLLRVVQGAWDHFLALKGVTGSRAADAKLPEEIPEAAIPFEHPDVRAIVDSMFLDGMLQPLETQERPEGIPDWARVGIVEDPNALERLVTEGIQRLAAELPSIDASFRDWLLLSQRLAEAYGEREGTRRMTNMVLQTQESWGAIERTEKGKRLVRRPKLLVHEAKVVAWLVEACVRYARRPLAVASMDTNPVAYPFDFGRSLSYVLSNSAVLELRSDSMSNQVVGLKGV